MPVGEDHPDDDPFEGLVLDDAFILGAPAQEASAEERTRRPEPRPQPRRRARVVPLAGRRRRRRRVRRRLARLLHGPWTPRRTITAMAVVLALLTALAVGRDAMIDRGSDRAAYSYDEFDASTLESNGGSGRPTASEGAAQPLGTPPTVEGDDDWSSIGSTRGEPARWDPCREVHYVTEEQAVPSGAETVIDDALAAIGDATGLVFVDDGASDEPLVPNRDAFQPDRYGDVWAPVLIAWGDIGEVVSDEYVVGVTNPVVRRADDGTAVIVTGDVVLDVPSLTTILYDEGIEDVLAVAVHELGHLVGLDHVLDDGEIMYPEALHADALGPGDRAGLAEMGRGPCVTGL